MPSDFDLEKERRIVNSGIRNIFTPYQPVMDRDLFFGRQSEVAGIIQQLNTPGQHSLLFGDRGVGKSSLANIASDVLKPLAGDVRLVKRCDSTDTFRTIVEPLLLKVGIDLRVTSTAVEKKEGGDAGINAGFAKAGVNSTTTGKTSFDGVANKADSPGWVAEQVGTLEALFLLDEIDVIPSGEKEKVAEFIKQLNDINHFIWSFDELKIQEAAAYDQKILEIKRDLKLVDDYTKDYQLQLTQSLSDVKQDISKAVIKMQEDNLTQFKEMVKIVDEKLSK